MSESLGNIGRLTSLSGSIGLETEDYSYTSGNATSDRKKLSTRFELNGNGFIWDPRFAVFGAGFSLQRDNVQATLGDSSYNLLGYRLNTTWFANRPHPLSLYANRTQNTVSDYSSPSYETITTTMGARWSMEDKWLGRTNLYIDHTNSESNNSTLSSLSLRSEQNLSFGLDSSKKILPRQWGESELTYGYRHSSSEEQVFGSKQRQDYVYLNDGTKLGDKANLTANITYYNRNDQFGIYAQEMASSFFGLNSGLTWQQTENFRHNYGLGLTFNEFGSSKSASQNVSGGVNYRFNEQWQTNVMLSLSAYQTEFVLAGANQVQDGNSTTGSGGVTYSDRWGNFLTNGGYNLTLMQTTTSGQPGRNSATHTANLGYTRMNTPLYTDSLQLRISQIQGNESNGSEFNVHYGVNSKLTARDLLQGNAEYRRYQQRNAVWNVSALTLQNIDVDSTSTQLNFGWQHNFSQTNSIMLSAGANSSDSQGTTVDTRYVQARASVNPISALQWTALARTEQTNGLGYGSGQKLTLESDLNYRIGKWQAIARYRMRDAKTDIAPFKENSITLFVKRNYDFRF